MDCQEFSQLEQAFLNVRKERLEQVTTGTLTPEREEQLSRAELQALFQLLDHRAQHSCDTKGDGPAANRLPRARNLGGIIGPY